MRLTSRSYPHPVVGNRDDVPGAAFQATIEMSSDKEAVYIDVGVNCSSKTINGLIGKGDAVFALHVECSNTLYRRVFEFHERTYRAQIPADHLNDAVEVNVFARATRSISGYRVDAAHSDYGSAGFEIAKADILAIAEGHVFYLDAPFDALSPIGSIMEIHEAQQDGDRPMQVDFGGPKIRILLAKRDFAEYKLLKSMEGMSVALTTTIVLPVLIEAIHVLQNDGEDDLRWVRALTRRLEDMGLSLEGEPLELAQSILELPVKRALSSARMLAENAS